jgi:hypothetical protein
MLPGENKPLACPSFMHMNDADQHLKTTHNTIAFEPLYPPIQLGWKGLNAENPADNELPN